jgi:hypothetical protein
MSDGSDDGRSCLIEVPNPFTCEPGTLRLREPDGGFSAEHLNLLREGQLKRPFIIDCGTTRNLFLTIDTIQGTVLSYIVARRYLNYSLVFSSLPKSARALQGCLRGAGSGSAGSQGR